MTGLIFGMLHVHSPTSPFERSFKRLLSSLDEGITSLDNSPKESQSEPCFDGEISMACCKDDKIYYIIKDMMDSSVGLTSSIALKKYRIIGEKLYHNACELYSKISSFEANIQRYYFDVRPLDANQLQNWHDYLDFIELQEDFDWAVKLYERCLIVCANYPDYWMRYVDFMEAKGGREIANYSLDRATEVYLKSVPAIHLFNARFKEQIGDVVAARAVYIHSGKETDSDFVENVISKANMEKRLGNMESALSIYKEALEMAAVQEKLDALPILYIHFFRLKCMSTNSVDAARNFLIDGIRTLPQNKLLLEELIKFSMIHGGMENIDVIDSVIADALSPRPDGSQGLSAEDSENISNLYLEFVNYCGTVHDIRKAWIRHIKLFPGSVRIGLRQQSNKHRRSLNLIKDTRGEISVAMHNQASRDSSSNLHGHSPQQNKKVSLEKNYDAANDGLLSMENVITRSNDTDMISLPIVESEDKAENNARELPLSVSKEPRENDPEKNLLSADLVEVKEEAIVVKKFKKKWSESDISSENLLHQTVSGNQPSQALQASSNANAVFSQGKCGLETEELKSLSMTGTSLNPWESTQPHSGLMTSEEECDTIPEGSKSNSRVIVGGHTTNQHNSASTQDSEPAQIHVGINRPYSTCHQDYRSKRPHLPLRYSRNSGGNLHSMRNAGKFHRGRKYGHHGYTPQKQHQQQQLSQQQIHQTEWGKQLPGTPACPQSAMQVQQCNQNQFQATATTTGYATTHSWPTQSIQIQNSLSPSQLPANTAPHVLQHTVQGNGQYGYIQNGQEYNLMWQQYYYQQQQLQLQQHYIQLQQQSFQQELPPQPEQHSQPEPLQPEQLQQLQLQLQVLQQQQNFQRQQPQQQEHSVYLQQLQPSTQSNSNPIADQGQAIVTSQSHEVILLQQSSEPALVSSPVLHHLQEKSTQEE